jgi:hypothetical protein
VNAIQAQIEIPETRRGLYKALTDVLRVVLGDEELSTTHVNDAVQADDETWLTYCSHILGANEVFVDLVQGVVPDNEDEFTDTGNYAAHEKAKRLKQPLQSLEQALALAHRDRSKQDHPSR